MHMFLVAYAYSSREGSLTDHVYAYTTVKYRTLERLRTITWQ